MMTWVSLVLTALKVVSAIMDYINRDALIQSGYDKAVSEAAASIMRKTATGKEILDRVNKMSDTEVDDALRDLEPK